MAIDFWNNPLVVSSFRLMSRRGGFTSLTLYVAFLGCACVAAWYLVPLYVGRPFTEHEKLHLLFGGLLVLQTALSMFLALITTSNAISVEVSSGTLDYQRLTPMTPAQVLTGKLLGPQATAYLMLIASIPFTFALWSLDATAISLGTLLLLYVQQLSSALLGAAIGLVKPLRSTPQKTTQQDLSGSGCLLTFLLFFPLVIGLSALPTLLARRETAPLGLILPVGPLVGLFEYDDPWHYTLSFFGRPVPFLLLTPLTQFAVGALCFMCMIRRLTNTANPALTKPLAYGVLFGIDVLAATVLFEPGPVNLDLGPRSTQYWLVHGLAAFFLASSVTPDRELLLSWIWRFRTRYSRLRDLCWQDRSQNTLVLLTFCFIGIAVYVLLVAVPALLVAGWHDARPLDTPVVHSLLLTCVLTMSLGTLSQTGRFLVAKGGDWILLLPVLFDLFAFTAGQHFQIRWLLECSIVAHWSSWRSDLEPLSALPFLGLHGIILLWSWRILRCRLRGETARVERKLREMGVVADVPAQR